MNVFDVISNHFLLNRLLIANGAFVHPVSGSLVKVLELGLFCKHKYNKVSELKIADRMYFTVFFQAIIAFVFDFCPLRELRGHFLDAKPRWL